MPASDDGEAFIPPFDLRVPKIMEQIRICTGILIFVGLVCCSYQCLVASETDSKDECVLPYMAA